MGSTSYITDASGEVYQHLEYFAFGETFVEEHSNTDRTPYLFNGKELDEETGLYYYGARYYDAKTSVFLSVDPMAEKYPFMSPYVYAANNPIRFVDVLGMGPGDPKHTKVLKSPVGNVAPSSGYKVNRNVVTPQGKGSGPHRGIDYSVPTGTSVKAMASGTVVRSGVSLGGYGNVVIIDHGKAKDSDKRVYTLYAHNSELKVNVGDFVEVGSEISLSGNTGKSTGPHVHVGAYLTDDDPTKIGDLLLENTPSNDSDRSQNIDPLSLIYREIMTTDSPEKRQILSEIFMEMESTEYD